MSRRGIPILAAIFCLLVGIAPVAPAQTAAGVDRGELLYTAHCSACHSTQIHWRDQRLATDWATLTAQVRRWQRNTGLSWDAGDTAALAHYLNTRFYRFPPADLTRD